MQRICTNHRTLLHKFWERSQNLCKSTTIGAIWLHFLCVSGPETHKKCKEIAPIVVFCYINFGNVPKIYVIKYDDWCNFLAFFVCVSGPEMHGKYNELAPIIVFCYINFGNVHKIYVKSTTIGAIWLHFLCVSGPETHEKCNEIAPIVVLLLHKFWERS